MSAVFPSLSRAFTSAPAAINAHTLSAVRGYSCQLCSTANIRGVRPCASREWTSCSAGATMAAKSTSIMINGVYFMPKNGFYNMYDSNGDYLSKIDDFFEKNQFSAVSNKGIRSYRFSSRAKASEVLPCSSVNVGSAPNSSRRDTSAAP